jgi:hypothetical protein
MSVAHGANPTLIALVTDRLRDALAFNETVSVVGVEKRPRERSER